MTDHPSPLSSDDRQAYVRFSLVQRIEHLLFLISFTLLAFTGLAQKYSAHPASEALLRTVGGIESTRTIHHFSAIVMGAISAYHILEVLYNVIVLRTPWTMLPWIDDAKHILQDVAYYLGFRKHKAYYGRYSYAEKMEYLAVVWGTLLMGLTGFMMWNPIASARFLPGQAIPAAKAAHGGEAVLAFLAIIIWHFYHVHLKYFNKSMFTGKLNRDEMRHEHPAELAAYERGSAWRPPAPELIRKRKRIFFPVAVGLTVAMLAGLVAFVTIEETAITTIPKGETVAIFVPLTPTPRPTRTPTPTRVPGLEVPINSWKGSIEGLFRNRCGTCHGITAVGGLSLATYKDALKGGNSGPGITPGNPDTSWILIIQLAGGHPGQLTTEEIQLIIEWITAGAPEE